MHAAHLLRTRAHLTPHREALLELATGTRYSYAALDSRANRLAGFLRRLGVGQGDRVAILAHNSVAYVDLFYGAAKIGAVYTPLNWRLVAKELAYILNDCEPKVLICGPEFVEVLSELRQKVSVLRHYVGLEGAAIENGIDYEQGLSSAEDTPVQTPDLGGEDPYCILYTSGTTGPPKGAVIPHRQVLWNCVNTGASWGLSERDVSPIFVPLFHAGGLFAFLTPLFYLGGRIVLARSLEVEESLRVIERERCSVILGVPTMYRMWLNAAGFAAADFSHVRWFISGGAPCPQTTIEAWRRSKGIVFRQGYGLTEVGPNCFTMTDEESVTKTGSVGKPIFHSAMRVVDEQGNDTVANEVGELIIRGPHVCSGYWRNPEATQKAIRDGWFHTGDMARRDADGFYYVVGRFKDMIISGGENIYAAEVEAVFLEHPAVAEAALIGQSDEKFGEVGLMVVVPRKGSSPREEELLESCQGKLARYKIPKRVVFAEALPYSPYGKVQKAVLRKQFSG